MRTKLRRLLQVLISDLSIPPSGNPRRLLEKIANLNGELSRALLCEKTIKAQTGATGLVCAPWSLVRGSSPLRREPPPAGAARGLFGSSRPSGPLFHGRALSWRQRAAVGPPGSLGRYSSPHDLGTWTCQVQPPSHRPFLYCEKWRRKTSSSPSVPNALSQRHNRGKALVAS